LSATVQAATQAPRADSTRPGLTAEQARALSRNRADGQHVVVDGQISIYIDDK
jgi:hypothetical protein